MAIDTAHIGGTIGIKKLLAAMPKLQASDLHIKVGLPPTYRIGGSLKPINAEPLDADTADHLLDEIMTEDQQDRLLKSGNVDFAWYLDSGPNAGERFRINAFHSGHHTHAAIRRVQAKIPDYQSLHLPPVYSKIVEETVQGLVLVVGVTGSGKSSTLAAMIDHVNATRGVNIITVEDPVEFRFTPKKSIISQREIGIDVKDFPTALRYVVRQDPDVIFVGEMRDHETVLAAIQAAETGHLVFATLHTSDTAGAFGRMLEFFPPSERDFVRSALSMCLKAICAQKLVPTVDGFESPIVPATEVLISNPIVREKIHEGEEADLPAIVGSSKGEGMHNFTQSLGELVQKEWVDLVTAREHAPNREQLDGMIKGVEVKAANLVGRIKRGAHA